MSVIRRIGFAIVTVTAVALIAVTPAAAQKKKAPEKAAEKPKADDGGPTTVDAKTGQKSKQYTFGGLDIDGKLKTPQLMYFLNRMKSEFDTTTPDKRSFIPELKRSTDEM
ncbi:MAG TPA: hypothetical protein VIA18_19025 [Polyangia bacterium]|nr:hypothetical protein [Polyangia bacterium]HWE30769.1 hypothetical protein [Polyangia bacterium]